MPTNLDLVLALGSCLLDIQKNQALENSTNAPDDSHERTNHAQGTEARGPSGGDAQKGAEID
jgi:hypothetical protein